MIESVAGMISAAPTPIAARTAISCPDEPANGAQQTGQAEDRYADLEAELAAEAVAQRAEDEQQA